jgi:hypothetical protein
VRRLSSWPFFLSRVLIFPFDLRELLDCLEWKEDTEESDEFDDDESSDKDISSKRARCSWLVSSASEDFGGNGPRADSALM